MARERLLRRIKTWSQAREGVVRELDYGAYQTSVLEDLSRILNTRQGTVEIDEQFGMPDFTNMINGYTLPSMEGLARDISNLIGRYESRVEGVSVSYAPRNDDVGVLRFGVLANLGYRDSNTPVNFFIMLHGDGSAAIEA